MNITAAEIQHGLQAFYEADASGRSRPHVADVALLGSGYEADVFAFSLRAFGEETARNLVLRLYAGEGAGEKSAREFAVMRRLWEIGYPVPQVYAQAGSESPFGRPFLIQERVMGDSLGPVYWSPDAAPQQEAQALLCRLMAQLHALDGKAILPDSPLAVSHDPYACVDNELAALARQLDRLEGREPPSLRAVLGWLRIRRAQVLCERPSVVHGDFHANNVLRQADGAAFVIDWSNARLADYRSDLAWTRLVSSVAARPDGGDGELRLYEQLTGKEVTALAYFEAMACAWLIVSVMISLHFGAAREGMRAASAAQRQRAAAHAQFTAALLQERTGIAMPDLEKTLSALWDAPTSEGEQDG